MYDAIGDSKAHQKVVECLKLMAGIIDRYDGQVIEIIGDELMATFPDPDLALSAACEIQERLAQDCESQLGVRIGFHFGRTAEANGHPYGDTVNVAARMVSKAKSGQIITNHQTCQHLAASNKARTRYIDRVFVKGKKVPYDLHEVVWDESESTVVVNVRNTSLETGGSALSLFLTYDGQELHMNESSGELVMGRGPRCGLIVHSNAASRLHGTVSYRNGKMVYQDQSTNGTYIRILTEKQSDDGADVFVHYEEWVCDQSGILSLGEPVAENRKNRVYFRIG